MFSLVHISILNLAAFSKQPLSCSCYSVIHFLLNFLYTGKTHSLPQLQNKASVNLYMVSLLGLMFELVTVFRTVCFFFFLFFKFKLCGVSLIPQCSLLGRYCNVVTSVLEICQIWALIVKFLFYLYEEHTVKPHQNLFNSRTTEIYSQLSNPEFESLFILIWSIVL